MTGHCELAHCLCEVECCNLAVSFAVSDELHLSDIREILGKTSLLKVGDCWRVHLLLMYIILYCNILLHCVFKF
jgi:hypothetical protein